MTITRKIKIEEFLNLVLLSIQPVAEILGQKKKLKKKKKNFLILKKIHDGGPAFSKTKFFFFFFFNFFFPTIFLCQKTMWQAILECR